MENVKKTLKEAQEKKLKERFINGCTAVSRFVKRFEQYIPDFRDLIVPLINGVKDNTGMVRKNAAILLSILAKDEANKEIIRNLHGIDVLASVNDYL